MYKIRIPLGIFLLSLVGLILYLDYYTKTPYFSKCVLGIVTLIALGEFYHLIEKRGYKAYYWYALICACLGIVLLIAVPPSTSQILGKVQQLWITAMFIGVMLRCLLDSHEEKVIERASVTVLGLVYIYFLLLYMYLIRDLGENLDGVIYLMFVILVVKGTDIGGYLVGKLIGKHKLCPHISPKKSWEGFVG
ncbi:MAG: phosphatidate cytidylyltransferase, partial [Candidatus Calescibacterium sp.]|nr:phosphatidate cytidylyltransferase [Candidatus Calescibacterium sp.]